MLLNRQQADEIWNWVETALKFRPLAKSRAEADALGLPPFQLPMPYAVYDISRMYQSQADTHALILAAFQAVTPPGGRLYALDWQHCEFLFDPRKPREMESVYVEDPAYPGGGYWACFPDFYPDGDYYFFIDGEKRFGYLAHPWRVEVWIFGQALVERFDAIAPALCWTRLPDASHA